MPRVNAGDTCPQCKVGTMVERHGSRGAFLGCSTYPACSHTQNIGAPAPAVPAAIAAVGGSINPAPAGSLDQMIRDIATRAAGESVNEDRVNALIAAALDEHAGAVAAIVAKAVANVAPAIKETVIRVNDLPAVTLAGAAHKALDRVLKLARAGIAAREQDADAQGPNIALVGPAGCGKTHLGKQTADALGIGFAMQSGSPDMSVSAIVGRCVPNITGAPAVYESTPFVDAFVNGWLFMWDECDNMHESALLAINSALANGHMTLPDGRRVTRHTNNVVLICMNTFGNGQSREYVGRTQLDAAFIDRFAGSMLSLDYDRDLERQLCPEANIREAVWAVRDKIRALPHMRRIVSTRGMLAVRRLVLALGDTVPQALAALAEGWTPEDKRACGIEG